MSGQDVLHRHTALFNEGVRSGDFGAMLAYVADEAELSFEGVPAGPFVGKPAITEAYRTQPPSDEIELLSVHDTGDTIVGAYAWRSQPRLHAGNMVLTLNGDQITRIVIQYFSSYAE